MKTIFETGNPGKNKILLPEFEADVTGNIPDEYLNDSLDLIDVNEIDAVRHYTRLSQTNFGVDTGMYPLGSCTMKHNPKINEKIASISNFTDTHPLSLDAFNQGSLQILFELTQYLTAITGMDMFSLAPAAGSHGELSGVMIIKKYFEQLGQNRSTILIPDTAHGTNPASVAMCGFTVKEIKSDENGNVDIEILKDILDSDVAAMMLTSPNTLGLFDQNITQIAELLHKNGSLFYGDGANFNAIIGKAKMSDMGFDIIHLNLHKTFSTPHGGGGPGSGPLGVTSKLTKFLPLPLICKKTDDTQDSYFFDYNRPDSIGRIHSFYGNFLIALRAYTYIRTLGPKGLSEISENAVLNANYLMNKLKQHYNLPINRSCMHEFILNDANMPNGITTNDIAKRLLDYGFHAPTVYFPLLIHGAIMIEPTETENLQTLDLFVEAMLAILEEAKTDPQLVKDAPHTTAVKKVDAVTAARKPVLKWEKN